MCKVSFSELWKVYCDTGFIYPEKQALMDIGRIQRTWEKLLAADENVRQVFVRRREGRTTHSLTLLHLYPGTWLMHHFVGLGSRAETSAMLADSVAWMLKNPAVHYIQFYWRPNNRGTQLILQHVIDYLKGVPETLYFDRIFDYYAVDAADWKGNSDRQGRVSVEVCEGLTAEVEVSGLLTRQVAPAKYCAETLRGGELGLPILGLAYSANGLKRSRKVLAARRYGAIVALAVKEFSSYGLNFSFIPNRLEFLWISPELDGEERLGVVSSIIDAALELRCEDCPEHWVIFDLGIASGELAELGLSPLRQYRCLTFPKELLAEAHRAAQRRYEKEVQRRYENRSGSGSSLKMSPAL